MSEKSHNSHIEKSTPGRLVPPAVVWAGLLALTLSFGLGLGQWMESIALGEPNPQRRAPQDGLRAVRALLTPGPAGDAILRAAQRGGAGTGFYLAGSIRAEGDGDPDRTRRWLALQALARGDVERTSAWIGDRPVDKDWLERLRGAGSGWVDDPALMAPLFGESVFPFGQGDRSAHNE